MKRNLFSVVVPSLCVSAILSQSIFASTTTRSRAMCSKVTPSSRSDAASADPNSLPSAAAVAAGMAVTAASGYLWAAGNAVTWTIILADSKAHSAPQSKADKAKLAEATFDN